MNPGDFALRLIPLLVQRSFRMVRNQCYASDLEYGPGSTDSSRIYGGRRRRLLTEGCCRDDGAVIRRVKDMPEGVLQLHGDRRGRREDYEVVLMPPIRELIEGSGKVRAVCQIGPDFHGYDQDADWEDVEAGRRMESADGWLDSRRDRSGKSCARQPESSAGWPRRSRLFRVSEIEQAAAAWTRRQPRALAGPLDPQRQRVDAVDAADRLQFGLAGRLGSSIRSARSAGLLQPPWRGWHRRNGGCRRRRSSAALGARVTMSNSRGNSNASRSRLPVNEQTCGEHGARREGHAIELDLLGELAGRDRRDRSNRSASSTARGTACGRSPQHQPLLRLVREQPHQPGPTGSGWCRLRR